MSLVFANNTSATVTSGGTTAPASGTVESWTVSSLAGFPVALVSGNSFHVIDPVKPGEKILVTAISGTGPYTWTVTRGDESTVTVTHAASFTVRQVVTGGDFALLAGQQLVYNVKLFGAVGDGITDDTAAIQAAINAATGSANPATTNRTPLAPVYLSPGTYKVTADLMIRSVNNFVLFGAGSGQTIIYASGTGFTQAVLFINGSADGVFKGFDIRGDGTEKCGSNNLWDGIRLDGIGASRTVASVGTVNTSASITLSAIDDVHYYDVGATITGAGIPASTTITAATPGTGWTLSNNCTATGTVTVTITPTASYAANRSTTGNALRDIRIRALKFVNGLSLQGNGGAQLDGTHMENIVVSGAQTAGSWSSTGLYQNGYIAGNGNFANNYDHAGFRIDASGCYYGMKLNASSIIVNGSQPAGNYTDFWFLPAGQSSIINVQSQNSGQFLYNPSGFSPNPVTIQDVISLSVYPTGGGNAIVTLAGGIWAIKNFEAELITLPSTWDQPVIYIFGGGTSTHPCYAVLENIVLNGTKTTCIQPTATKANVSVRNYCNYNPATGLYTTSSGDVDSCYTGSAWVNTV